MVRLLPTRRASSKRGGLSGDDVFGEIVAAHLRGEPAYEILERDDGYIGATRGPSVYFQPFAEWMAHQREAMAFVSGRAIDIGAGAGRAALALQEKGVNVTAIDNSPLAIRVCKQRGVKRARVADIGDLEQIARRKFDTLLLLGGNFGLVQSPARAQAVLATLHRSSAADARLIAESVDPYRSEVPGFLTYANHGKRKWAGSLRMRLRFRDLIGGWFDYLLVSPAEMEELLDGTGWYVREFLNPEGPGTYIALIEKEPAAPAPRSRTRTKRR